MKTKAIIAGIVVISVGLVFFAGGCRHGDHVRKVEGAKSVEARDTESTKVPGEQANLSFTAADEDGVDLAEKEEIRRKYALNPESSVRVRGINGGVRIETADTDQAEVLIVRSAKTRDDLQFHKVNIEQDEDSLNIRVEGDRKSIFSALASIPEGHQRVVLKLPRKVELFLSGTNGKVKVGEIQGRIRMDGINGEIRATRIAGETTVHGINGGVDLSFAPLNGNGIEVGGINGNIDLRFEGEVNAEVNAFGVNGQINADLPGVQNKNDDESGRGRYRARIGSGGTQIRVNGINGNVNLSKAQRPAANAAKLASK